MHSKRSAAECLIHSAMSAIAIIPARSGSKGIPDKNIRPFCGSPLVVRAVDAANSANQVGRVIVSTDSAKYAGICHAAGADAMIRPLELSGDSASSESALLHVLETLRDQGEALPEWLVFIQCTSPFTRGTDIDALLDMANRENADTGLTVVPSHRFLWRVTEDGSALGINHDKSLRQRRQDRALEFMENGAVYAMRVEGFLKHKHRFFGKTVCHVLPEYHAVEIDSPEDWEIAESIFRSFGTRSSADQLPDPLALLVFDFDGVFTDNRVLVSEDGSESVFCDRGDGMGIEWLRQAGVPCLILSKERNPVVEARGRKVQVPVVQSIENKAEFLKTYCLERGIPLEHVAYVGNDMNDIECMGLVGCGISVGDAVPRVREVAKLHLERPGGRGAIRELAEIILKRQA